MWFAAMALVAATALCPASAPPVDGPLVAGFAPIGRYAGHWGVDYRATPGTEVAAVADGVVSFAGSVAGRASVSIDHGRGFVTTVSYLESISVRRGERVRRGQVVGTSGTPHGTPGVHLSLRIAGVYVDPKLLFGCEVGDISDALWLVPTPP